MDVIVIGCGAAGVAAMRKLHDAGLQVLGLEAADRIGGRICTVQFGDRAIDIGAAWCHGEKDNKVFELANPLDLLGRPEPNNTWYVQSNGNLVSADSAQGILKVLDDELVRADKYGARSISECVRNAEQTNEILKKDPKLSRSFVEWFERNSHLGGQTDPKTGKSLRGLIEFWNSEGEFMLNWKGRGYKTILDVLTNKYPDPSKEIPLQILLNKEVENIRWGTNQRGLDNPLVQVSCKDGSLYAAKSVIITMSVGVLKERYTQLFNPPLPAEKVNTIQNLQMCVLDKIYIEFEKTWWPKSPANFTILWREEDKAQFSVEEKWITEIYGLMSVDYQPNVLLAWIYGNGAEDMEKVSQEKVQAGVQKLIDVVLKKQFNVAPIKRILREQTNEILKKDPKLSRSFVEWFERNSHLGGQTDPKTGKSLRGLIEFWNSEGEFMLNWKGRGYKTILDVLTNKYPDPSKEIPLQILLNKEVENIRWGTNQRGLDNPLVQVSCKDGSLYAAKSVIITMSVGVLKERYTQLFNPPLPAEKVNTIQNLQMCVLDKIYIEFEKTWWPKSPANFTILWREEDKAQFSVEEKWITEIYGLMSVDYQPNVLLAWIYGNGAEDMEKVSQEKVQAGVQKLIDVVLKKQFNVAPIKRILRSQWASNPLTRGAYAHRTVALEEKGGSAITLSEPLHHSNTFPVVCFAGEATSHHRHTAVHGAVESGFREADRLIESFQRLEIK